METAAKDSARSTTRPSTCRSFRSIAITRLSFSRLDRLPGTTILDLRSAWISSHSHFAPPSGEIRRGFLALSSDRRASVASADSRRRTNRAGQFLAALVPVRTDRSGRSGDMGSSRAGARSVPSRCEKVEVGRAAGRRRGGLRILVEPALEGVSEPLSGGGWHQQSPWCRSRRSWFRPDGSRRIRDPWISETPSLTSTPSCGSSLAMTSPSENDALETTVSLARAPRLRADHCPTASPRTMTRDD